MFLKLDLLDIYHQEQMLVYFFIWNSIFAGHAYEGRKARLLSGWEQLQPELRSAFYALQASATHECMSCHLTQDEVIRCQDCGPAAYFCSACCIKAHEHAVLHYPERWTVSISVHIMSQSKLHFLILSFLTNNHATVATFGFLNHFTC